MRHRRAILGRRLLEHAHSCREEPEGLDHLGHRLLELGLLALGVLRRAIPPRPPPVEATLSPHAPARSSAPSTSRQRRSTGVVGAVAIAEMREGRQEVARITPLGCEPLERTRARPTQPGPGPPASRRGARRPRDWHRRLGRRLRARRSMLPATLSSEPGRPSRPAMKAMRHRQRLSHVYRSSFEHLRSWTAFFVSGGPGMALSPWHHSSRILALDATPTGLRSDLEGKFLTTEPQYPSRRWTGDQAGR